MFQGIFKTLESVKYIICEPVEENSEGSGALHTPVSRV